MMLAARIGLILITLSLAFYVGAMKNAYSVMEAGSLLPTATYWVYLPPLDRDVNLTLGVLPRIPGGGGGMALKGRIVFGLYGPDGRLLMNRSLSLPCSVSFRPKARGLYKLVIQSSTAGGRVPLSIRVKGVETDKFLMAEACGLIGVILLILQLALKTMFKVLPSRKPAFTGS